MKFEIIVKNKDYGEIVSETYNGSDSDYEKLINELLKPSLDLKLDFHDKDGTYIVIPVDVLKQSIIFVKRLGQ